MQTITLNNGLQMPILGYGTFQIEPKETQKCVEEALELGYRHIDTAAAYQNESELGAALKSSGLKREEIFITTKLWVNDVSEEGAKKGFENSLKNLGLDYIDLYLIHMPYNDIYGAWRTLSKLYKEGKIKALGVSNFLPDRITDFCLHNQIRPAINQIEIHPFYQNTYAQSINENLDVKVMSWASFAEGKNKIFSNEILKNIGKKYGKSPAQVILRWLLERGIPVIPKSVRKEKMRENVNIFDFNLDSNDMAKIACLEQNKSYFVMPNNPQHTQWIIQGKKIIDGKAVE
ncbi:aldo/keto reductase [uncultured Helicobacter sp.]|uniref:aldo/keto reductase n=1 Tax=uncultured Helicobacter sp. TaxID=175537 RepID=UPI00374F1DB5